MNNKKVLICSNYAWTIYNFRMPLIRNLKKKGYEIEVVTQFDGYEKKVGREVNRINNLLISREGTNPIKDFFTLSHLFFTLIKTKPDIFLLFTIKPVIYGSIVSKLLKVPVIPTITGLGTVFIKENILTRIVKQLYRLAFSSVPIVFFQNQDDMNLFINQKLLDKKKCYMSPGSGIDINTFSLQPLLKSEEKIFLFIGRMIWDKGVGDFIKAAKKIKSKYPNVRFQLLGPCDVQNRTAIDIKDIDNWERDGVVEYLGETDDVVIYIKKSSCVVLPSYREGLSRVLLEAAAVGRPVIASDVPGCREVIDDGVNGFLSKPRDFNDLSDKIENIILLSYESLEAMGLEGRKKVEEEFNKDIVCKLYTDAIKKVVE
ncbi:MAG: glycosyltransferase family 1 protein [Flavobacteriales bacterium]|nr:glycosyltransferase family 1 protein [Flavobacteriales bacterium]